MATIGVWEIEKKAPRLVKSVVNSDILPGAIDYLGGDSLILTTIDFVWLLSTDVNTLGNVQKQIYKWPGGADEQDGLGVAINHSRQPYEHDPNGFDGHQCYITRQVVFDEIIGYDFVLFDYIFGAVVKTMASFGGKIPSGLVFNGKDLIIIVGAFDSVEIVQYNITTSTGQIVKRWTTSGGFIDICFDGSGYWVLSSTNFKYYDATDFTNPMLTTSAHSLTNPMGITFDGNKLITLSN